MITQTVDPNHLISRARQIKALIPNLLSQWGLVPKFKRWRLAQDPGTGMVVLFGVLNTKYIAMHTTTPFSNYFDPRLLRDMATELHVQVVSSANDGLRYAFILKRGQIGLPKDAPTLADNAKVGAICAETIEHHAIDHTPPNGVQEVIETRTALSQPNNASFGKDLAIMHKRLVRFLKMTEILYPMNNVATQSLPDVLFMDEAEFNRQGRAQGLSPIITISKFRSFAS
jgi:hypothetical protein